MEVVTLAGHCYTTIPNAIDVPPMHPIHPKVDTSNRTTVQCVVYTVLHTNTEHETWEQGKPLK